MPRRRVPPLRPLTKADLAGRWVHVGAAQLGVLDGDQEPLGVHFPGEALGPLALLLAPHTLALAPFLPPATNRPEPIGRWAGDLDPVGGDVLGQVVRVEADEAADLAVGDAALEHQPPHMPGRDAKPLSGLLQGQQLVRHRSLLLLMLQWCVAPPRPPAAAPAPWRPPTGPTTAPPRWYSRTRRRPRRRRSPPGRRPRVGPKRPRERRPWHGGVWRRRPGPGA